MSEYPSSIYTPRIVVDRDLSQGILGDIVLAEDHNKDANEIVAVQTALETNLTAVPVIKTFLGYTAGPVNQNGADIDYIIHTIPNIQANDVLHLITTITLEKKSAGLDNYILRTTFWDGTGWNAAKGFREITLSAIGQFSYIIVDYLMKLIPDPDGRIRLELESIAGDWTYTYVNAQATLYRNVPWAFL